MDERIRLARGLWRTPETVADEWATAAALLALCPSGAVIAGWSAARLHGLWLPDRPPGPLEVIVHPGITDPTARGRNRRPEIRARRQHLRPDEIATVCGLPVTTEARTWIDLATRLSPADLVAAGDAALRGAVESSDELHEATRRARHCRGVVLARAVLPMVDARSRSRPESHLRYALVSAGLPRPEVNVAVHDEFGGWLAEPDLSYEDVRLALEYNGADHGDVDRMRRDITRGIGLSGSRWRTEVFGPVEVFRRPDQIAQLVAGLRLERARFFR